MKNYQENKKEVLFPSLSVWLSCGARAWEQLSGVLGGGEGEEWPSSEVEGGCQNKLLLEQFPLMG